MNTLDPSSPRSFFDNSNISLPATTGGRRSSIGECTVRFVTLDGIYTYI